MEVKLLHNTPLNIADFAISKCWAKECDMDNVNTEKIQRVANKFKHSSTVEHITYNFDIKGISRAVLQELSRHRMANLSVKSSRYTLKELKEVELNEDSVKDFIVFTGNSHVDAASLSALSRLQELVQQGISNDLVKYCMPECYKTELVWTCNARALQNFISLRTNKSALWEIQDLAHAIFEAIPDDHKFLFEDYVYKEKEKK